ncbi:MAG: hypothetical protein WCC81_20290 [Pseudolabrys sp.]|jgi:hypothetical protein
MPIFTYFAVVGSVLIALMFVTNATLETSGPAIVTSDQIGLPKPKPRRPDPIQILSAAPAPAPDMTSPLVRMAAPKIESAPEVLAVEPAVRAARAEAPPQNKAVTDKQPPAEYRQNHAWPRDFGLAGL